MAAEPRTEPFAEHRLRVAAPHILCVREYGDPQGLPAVFLHGGPGSGCRPSLLKVFPGGRFRVVAPDQRGAGDSEPRGCLEHNTTQALIADLEAVRAQLGIERWLVVGGSWGALLAVAYAEAHPRRAAGVVVRSLFLGEREELQRAFIDTPRVFYPEAHARFVAALPAEERGDPLAAYYRRVLSSDPETALPAIFAWHDYERCLSALRADPDAFRPDALDASRPRPRTPTVEAHYFANDCFLRPGQLLAEAHRLKGIPGVVVQARYDLLCPPITAWRLAQAWPDCEIMPVEAAGHSQSEPGVEAAMTAAVQKVARKLGWL